jgi:hypothetical protein
MRCLRANKSHLIALGTRCHREDDAVPDEDLILDLDPSQMNECEEILHRWPTTAFF